MQDIDGGYQVANYHTHICPRDGSKEVVQCEEEECDGYCYCPECSNLFAHQYREYQLSLFQTTV